MKSNYPETISALSADDVKLLIEAIRVAAQLPRYMNDPETSFRLGYILGMLAKEVLKPKS